MLRLCRPLLALSLALLLLAPPARAAELYPQCAVGQRPTFARVFAPLQRELSEAMGEPLECERVDPATGELSQQTSTGRAVQRAGLPIFTAGVRKWALLDGRVVFWIDSHLEPPLHDVPTFARPPAAPPLGLLPRPTGLALNGSFLMVSMHGALFTREPGDFAENAAYAAWLGAGVIRVFATDSNLHQPWDGRRVAAAIARNAPTLRQHRLKLVVALVNNHQPVPGEPAHSHGWMDGYYQLLLPFYTDTWRGPYRQFVRDLVGAVRDAGALDVIHAWELGNELHTPQNPVAVVRFIEEAVAELRQVDPRTPIYPGTMGANHLQAWQPRSPVARWVYCEAPVDAYTLHAYDWVSRQRQGDMPIEWDLDHITAEPCPSGRRLPVIVEELGTSRWLEGVYGAEDERRRLQLELEQIRFVLGYPQVQGLGVWSGESPRLRDRTFNDNRRGLTSYGAGAEGGGSCYDPRPDPVPGVRCELERVLQGLASGPRRGSARE